MISKKHGPTLCLESWSQTIIIGKMGGWIDEWMNGWTDGWVDGRTGSKAIRGNTMRFLFCKNPE